MNTILIWEPRWHDRVVLIADRRLAKDNQIIVQHKDFPVPFYLTGERAKQFPLEEMPTKAGGILMVRAVPLSELEKEVIDI